MSSYDRYINATQQASTDAGLSLKNKLAFHLFNPNGLCAVKAQQDAEIDQLVQAGTVPSGWHLVYGGLNYFYVDQLYALNKKKKAPSAVELNCYLRALAQDIKKAREKIDEVQQGAV